ncbi:hypothetical protein CORC01_01585 [Colletotrichum orchidophilum]|uniref:Major facilitator superfamily (MFS) profile domain-containing protein n=1 Tax=Colletotrichum orchidophilum TaxID=1209926 RepID=A0A1G4BP13_9PEZI|nr:uncharacterized protein CORC01_01585 [Colletotrichum orchidophilum]OHF03201.1 hypothetical protein CORC01_01585 [Colletotrichum orchidophilum]
MFETREEIEEELHIEVVPGTEVMADVLKHHLIKSEHSTVVLVPQPSQDPHDPLNWKASWKWTTLGAISLMTFSQGFAPLSLAPMFPYLIRDYNSSLEDVIQFTGVTILILGFSNFIWAPISSSFGRRPVMIISQLICLASHVLRAKATTYGSFMGACVLNGIGAGPTEILPPQIAPVVSGPMADHVGWQNFWWLNVALTGASIVYGFFGFPETRWIRAQSTQDTVTIEVAEETTNEVQPTEMDPYLGRGTPSKQQWYLFQRNASPLKTIWFDLWTPWRLFGFPIVVFASVVVTWSCSNFLILNLTQSQVFAAPPYNMSSQSIGFTNLAVFVGALIGLVTAGPFSDWVSARATARNNGIREPEMRLPAMIPFVLVMVFGNIITAVGYQNHWAWPIIVVLGYASAGIQVAALPSIASTYAIDCYKPVTGPLMVATTVYKNVWGYGMGKFITPWTVKAGFIPAFMTNMALSVFFCATGIIFYFYGKTFRRWTRNSSVHNL